MFFPPFFPKGCRIHQVLKQLPLTHTIYNTLSPLPRMQRHSIHSQCTPEEPGRMGRKVLRYLEDKVRGQLQLKVQTVLGKQ